MEHEADHQQPQTTESHQPEKKDRFLSISILVAAGVVGGAVVFAALYIGPPISTRTVGGATAPTTNPQPSVSASQVMQLGSRDAILGNPNASVTLIEYGDYQCPFCGRFFSQTQPQIVADYVNTGKVRMVFRNFAILGAESTAAAQAAECAEDQNKRWAYSDALYAGKVADDGKGGGEDDRFFNRALFLKLAGQIGLDVSQFTSCIDGNKDASIVVQQKSDAIAAGVNSTPTLFINGQQILGAQPYAAFKTIIDAALAGK